MHHCFFCHGLRTFFQVQAHRPMGQGLNHSQFNHTVRQQAQIPVVVALGGRAAGQGDQMGLPSVVHLVVPVGLDLVLQDPVCHSPRSLDQ